MDGQIPVAHGTGSFLSLAFLTYISIVFGELYPKTKIKHTDLKDGLAVSNLQLSFY